MESTKKDLIVYRHWGGGSLESQSPWFATKVYAKPGNARRFGALPNLNTATNVTAYRIKAGSTMLRGKIASQANVSRFGKYATGRGEQIYLLSDEFLESIGRIR